MREKWPEELNQLFREIVPGRSERQIREELLKHGYDISLQRVHGAKSRLNVRSGTKANAVEIPTYSYAYKYPGFYEYLAEICAGRSIKDIAELMSEKYSANITADIVKGAMNRHKLCNGRDTRFKPGETHRVNPKGYIHPNAAAHQFKKGNRPQTARPVGTEVARDCGIIWVKVAEPNKWRRKHDIAWEQYYGEAPKRHERIIHLDHNQQNFDKSNLRKTHMAVFPILVNNGLYYSDSPEVFDAAITMAELQLKVGRIKKSGKKRRSPESGQDGEC